ncbi:MAG: hypothetical protein V1694_02755 [Candidatus Eisenbacteria bacterium]
MRFLVTGVLVLVLAVSAYGLEKKALQMREDFGTEPMYNCYMNYYYYIPCPTSSWFWSFSGWPQNSVVGQVFRIGDPSMSTSKGCPPYSACDPFNALLIEKFRVLDFAGYGTLYPGLFTVEFQLWCSTWDGTPAGPPFWSSGPKELCTAGWNYISIPGNSGCVYTCYTDMVGGRQGYPRFLITAKMIGSNAVYPQWGFDNISTPLGLGCAMHDEGCCPALYPRPATGHYGTIHSGYYGVDFQYCPPQWFLDPRDSTGDVYGYVELAWRVYLVNTGPCDNTPTEPSTWGSIKSMYR